jgi:hypothetical protein
MSFLQLGFLLALPLALLPVLIHLLNRLRYRTVRWAAMPFLLQASRSSTRRSRLRHYLILASRCLLLACFLLALARPLVGGWLGASLSGRPDVVLLLLDRSASMERLDPRHQATRREHALRLFAAGAAQLGPGPRYLLVDGATARVQEIADPGALPGLAAAGPTDTGGDAGALVQAALDHLVRNPAGKSELWLASDLQSANWRPDSPRWTRLGAALAALPGDNRLRLLDLSGAPGENLSLALEEARVTGEGRDEHLLVTLRVRRPDPAPGALPITVEIDGARSQFELEVGGAEARVQRRLPLPAGSRSGWGSLRLPADANLRDNTAWFVFGPTPRTPLLAAVAEPASARLFRLAAAPDPALRPAEALDPARLPDRDLSELAVVVWQPGPESAAAAPRLEAFARSGGAVLVVPPALPDPPPALGLSWRPVEDAPAAAAFTLAHWEEDDGPFARAANGVSLPLADLAFSRRRAPLPATAQGEEDGAAWAVLASFADQQPFALQRRVGRGTVTALAALPAADWSNLGDGRVLVPLMQRLLAAGGTRLSAGRLEEVGAWTPAEEEAAAWLPADGEAERDPRVHAGVWRRGEQWIALNRPAGEDEPDQLEPARAAALFGPEAPVSVAADLGTRAAGGEQGEIWRALIIAALLFLLVESALLAGLFAARPAPSSRLPTAA